MALTDLEARRVAPGEKARKLADGDGLYLLVQPTGAKYWRRDYQFDGRRKTAAIGVYLPAGAGERDKPAMTITEARAAALQHRATVASGVDPAMEKAGAAARKQLDARQAQEQLRQSRDDARSRRVEQQAKRDADRATVRRVADQWVDASESGWTLDHAHQVRQSLEDHVHPHIGSRPITDIDTGEVLDVLARLLQDGKVETASRVYQRLSAIWDHAILYKLASRDVIRPVGREFTRLKKLALKRNPRRNFAAVDRIALPGLLRAMRDYQGDSVTRLALRLLALTFTRTTELRLARWAEFDLLGEEPTWTIPVDRMKIKLRGDRQADPHLVPLSRQAVETLQELGQISGGGELVFPQSRKRGMPISENAILYAIWGMGYKDKMTGHGWRAVASTMLHELGWSHEAIEAQLAHEKSDATSAAYNRAAYLETRRKMMQVYADQLDALEKGTAGLVVPIRRSA